VGGMSGDVELARADGAALCRARVASSLWSRLRGLLGSSELPEGEGLLLPRTRSIHTHFMRFPIDAVFLDDGLRVVSIVPSLRPWRTASAKAATSTLELRAGTSERVGLAEGDALVPTRG
jgi:uncharacterized protein